jgi:tape measure domain-containing protein
MAQVREDKVQLRLDFITDESKSFAKTIEDTKKFNKEIHEAQKEIERLEKDMVRLEKADRSTIGTKQMLAEAQRKMTDAINGSVKAGQSLAGLDLRNVAPDVLGQRLRQVNEQLKVIPESIRKSHPEAKALKDEADRIKAALDGVRGKAVEVGRAMADTRQGNMSSWLDFTAKLGIAFYALQRLWQGIFEPSKLASDLAQARVAFETMLGSAVQADELIRAVVKKAANTPFQQSELIDYTKRLLAMGIESRKVIQTMDALGNIAAGVGKEKLPQLVLAFGQVNTKTKLAGGEIKQFSEAGVPLIDVLAKQFGVTGREILKMSEAGTIGFKDVERAIFSMSEEGGKFAGLMAKQAQTTEGLMSTLKDNVNIVLTAFGEGLNESLNEILKSSIAFTNGLDTEKVKAFGRSVGEFVKFIVDYAPAILRLVTIWGAYSAALGVVDLATKVLNRTMTISPIGLFVASLVAAVEAAQYFASKITEATAAQKAHNEIIRESTLAVVENKKQSDALFAIVRDGTATQEQHKKALDKILEIYPQYLGDIKTAEQLLGKLDTAQQRVNAGIIEEGIARIKAQKVNEQTNKLIDLRLKEAEQERALQDKVKELAADKARFGTRSVKSDQLDAPDQISGRALLAADAALKTTQAEIAKTESGFEAMSKSFDKVGIKVAQTLEKTIATPWSRIDAEIKVATEELAKVTDAAAKKTLEERIKQLKTQRDIEINYVLETKKKTATSANTEDTKASEKAAKAAAKQLKEYYDIQIGEAEVYWETEILMQQIALSKKQLTKAEFSEQELILETLKYENLLALQVGYLGRLELGTKEYIKTQKEILDLGEKIAINRGILSRDAAITDILPALGSSVKSQTADPLRTIQDQANIEKALVRDKFGAILSLEQEFNIKKLEIQSTAFARQLQVLTDNGATETAEYKRIAAAKKEVDNDLVENKKKLAEIEKSIEESKKQIATDSFEIAIDLLSADQDARKKHAGAIKAFQTGQIITNGILEVQKIWATVAEYGIPLGPILGGVMTGLAVARAGAAIRRVNAAKFAKGGLIQLLGGKPHSQGGTKGYFEDGTTVEMERGEALAVVNKENTPLLRMFSSINAANGNGVPYFEGGGLLLPNTTPNPANFFTPQYGGTPNSGGTSDMILGVLIAKFDELKDSVEKNREVKLYRDKLEDAYTTDDEDRTLVAWSV